MQLRDGQLVFSPSDLSAFLACPHLTSLQVAVAYGREPKPFRPNPHADLIRRKGDEHEEAYLERLRADGKRIAEPKGGPTATEATIRERPDVVYQPELAHDGWRGFADFLELQPDGTYEVVDTKLARRARPEHVLQLSFYTEQLARIQGSWPAAMHVVGGTGDRESFRPDDFLAYYRRLRTRFVDAVAQERATYPYPVEHCALCNFLSRCGEQWERDDHLVLVANVRRDQAERLNAGGIATLASLARAGADERPQGLREPTFATLRQQARLQLEERETGEPRWELLPLEPERGFQLLPELDEADVYLDLEGDPFYEPARGLDYLLGVAYREGGELVYRAIRAADREGEKRAFEELVDFVVERRRARPGLHVYHYNHYERTALRRLMGEHGTREEEIDDLLRGEVLVDLFQVFRQALRISKPSYSLKQVEKLFGFERRADVRSGGESAVLFEEWLGARDDALLEEIERYNEEDCRATEGLHRWLVGERPPEAAWRLPPERRVRTEETTERLERHAELRARVLLGAEEGDSRWLLGQLLEYHRREEKPQWWEYFHHRTLDEEGLIEDGDTIGGLRLVGEPVPDKQSFVYRLSFPPQEHKIGGRCVDPASERGYSAEVDNERGLVRLRRAKRQADLPLPRALIPPKPIGDYEQRDAVTRFAEDYLSAGERYPALAEILERRPPRARLDVTPVEAATTVDHSYLFVQGPPGSGKTFTGARMAVELMRLGQRVGVTSRSHKAIHKFLQDVEEEAFRRGHAFVGAKKCGDDEDEETAFQSLRGFVRNEEKNEGMRAGDLQLIAGTAWLFSRDDQRVDTLFVDEAGQVSLADAIAVGTAARNVILLGDPNQLPQVSQGAHPPGANASVLAHLLGEDETVPPDRGLFLERTWRMRPEVNAFISETFYEGRLEPAKVCYERSLADGNGIRFLPVAHEGHRQASPEEARAIGAEIERLVGTRYTDEHGDRVLTHRDVVVVAPYNAHVRCLRDALPDAVEVGTVDKFQGQQAPVVFYSMASSSGRDVPRGLDFLFSRNRLNVAISRAQCLAYLVASARLLEVDCRTVEQMRLANALCRLVEVAEGGKR
jgi:predicted RecB family nuclease